MPVFQDFQIKKNFMARYIWKIINLLSISFTEGVTNQPEQRRWSLQLSAGQCTTSSCTSVSCFVMSSQTHCSQHVATQHETGWLLHLGRGAGMCQYTGYGRSAAEGDEHMDWLPAGRSRRSKWSVAKKLNCLCSYTRRSLGTALWHSLLRFMTALNVLSQWHFCQCHTVVNYWNKLFDFHTVVELVLWHWGENKNTCGTLPWNVAYQILWKSVQVLQLFKK